MDIPFELVLLEECQPFLEEFKKIYLNGTKLPLRRGMLIQPTDHITKIKVNKNRTPTNSSIRVHNASDQWFYEKFGIKARSQSTFTTSSNRVAKDYGFPFLIFPVGNFEVIWSRKVDDLFMHLHPSKILNNAGIDLPPRDAIEAINDPGVISDKQLYEVIAGMLETFDYVKGSLDQALASKNEIMLLCDYYYIAKNDDESVLEFIKDYLKGIS